jgi:hypothetical protein
MSSDPEPIPSLARDTFVGWRIVVPAMIIRADGTVARDPAPGRMRKPSDAGRDNNIPGLICPGSNASGSPAQAS